MYTHGNRFYPLDIFKLKSDHYLSTLMIIVHFLRQKTYLKTYLILDFDVSEKYNVIHKAIVFFFWLKNHTKNVRERKYKQKAN